MGVKKKKKAICNIDLFYLLYIYTLYTIHQELWVIYGRTTDLSSTASSHAQPVSAAAAAIWQRRRVEILKYFLNSVALLARIALDA